MNKILTLILTVLTTATFAQIDMTDSTAQVIAYWDLGEKQSYSVSLQKIKLRDADTTSNSMITYNVDITIIDSTESSYLTEWHYYNYKTNSTNFIAQKVAVLAENLKVIIETNEYGAFKSVKNWEEVSEYMKKVIQPLKEKFEIAPKIEQVFTRLEYIYTTKQGIEAGAIQDAQQFLTFHGASYLLGEVLEFPMQIPNMYYPESPLDSKIIVYLDELNPDDHNYIIRSSQEVDSEQLTKTTLKYLKSMSKSMETAEPANGQGQALSNVITTDSRIHESGWVIYSIQTKVVEAPGGSDIEERIIEIE